MNPASIYAAGKVRRWHANPILAETAQTNADHQGAAVQLLLALHPDPSIDLIRAVAFHDLGERWVGDLPRPFKDRSPQIALAHADAEAIARGDALGDDPLERLGPIARQWLGLIDALEAWCHVALTRPDELRRDDWPATGEEIHRAADRLRVGQAVAELMVDMVNRDW